METVSSSATNVTMGSYAGALRRVWEVPGAPPGMDLVIHAPSLDLGGTPPECNGDALKVYAQSYTLLMASYCGASPGNGVRLAGGHNAVAVFTSQAGSSGDGFVLDFRHVPTASTTVG